MIVDLTKHGISLNKRSLLIFRPVVDEFTRYTEDFIFPRTRDYSYREYLSPFHTGSQEERKEKHALKEENDLYDNPCAECPICGKIVKILPWRDSLICSDCSLEVNNIYSHKSYKETFKALNPRDRTQWILDIWNRNY